MKPFIAAALLLTLCGCAQRLVWEKPGATAAMFEQDKNQCIYEAKLGTPTVPSYGTQGYVASQFEEGMREGQLQTLCMKARGYTQRAVKVEQ
jgi:hypothetical protein